MAVFIQQRSSFGFTCKLSRCTTRLSLIFHVRCRLFVWRSTSSRAGMYHRPFLLVHSSNPSHTSSMARQETTRRRVSNLVGRFEELAGASPSRISDSSLPPTSPQSTHPASYHEAKAFQQHDRRSFSLSSIPSSLQARLDKEFKRNKQLRDECEQLRTRCYENDAILTALSQQLEEGTNVRQTLHVQTAGLQAKVDRLADKLARRDQVQRTTYERRIAAVANERDILVSKLRIAEEAVEQAKAADERALVASRQAQALRSQLLELKTDVAARKGGRESVSDQEIFGMMSTLNHMIQNWTVSTFRKVKIGRYHIQTEFPFSLEADWT